jgi:hypothetical protein
VFGMEHKADLVEIAQKDGLRVWQEFPERADQVFGGASAQMLPEGMTGGKFDVFLSFNFLEHQPQPSVMLQAIYRNLSEDGMGLVTVPALEYIVEQGSYYELIHDHIAYYSFDALRELLERNGFRVLEEEMLNRDTIAMIVKKIPLAQIAADAEPTDNASERADGDAAGTAMVESLVRGYEKVQKEIEALAAYCRENRKKLAVWGASHQGFTLTSTTSLGSCASYIIDSAPFKQGRFAPASHLPIVAPDHFHDDPVDTILIVAPGYTDEIAASIREKFGFGVQILTMRTDHIEELK